LKNEKQSEQKKNENVLEMRKIIQSWQDHFVIDSGFLFEILLIGIIPQYLDQNLAELFLDQ